MSAPEKPLPYYRWYPRDYRASRRANELGYLARGFYRELLDECWEEGYVPDDLERLAKICRCPIGVMARAWKQLRPMFDSVEGLDGELLRNTRLEVERTKEDKLRVQRVRAGKASAAQRNERSTPVDERNIAVRAEQSSSTEQPTRPGGVVCPECEGRGGVHRWACSHAGAST